MVDPPPPVVETGGVPSTAARSPIILRVLGVVAAAVLGIGTFAALGLAIAQVLYDRGVIGNVGAEELEALGYLVAGAIAGAAVGVVASLWVGLRIWQGRWALLVVLLGVTVATAATLAVTAA
jgi:hypothetical protein